MENLFGAQTFAHFSDVSNSAYLMANRANDMKAYIEQIQQGFSLMYPEMFNLNFSELS
jgi:hypothetical protein